MNPARLSGDFSPVQYRIAIDLPFNTSGGDIVPTVEGMRPVAFPTDFQQFFGVCEIIIEASPTHSQPISVNSLNMGVLSLQMRELEGAPTVVDDTASDSFSSHGPYCAEGASVVSDGWFVRSPPSGFSAYGSEIPTTYEVHPERECIEIRATHYPRYFSLKVAYIGAIGDDKCTTSGIFSGDGLHDPNMFVTQMEPTLARSVYPCFDEPAFKAPMQLALAYRKGLAAISSGRLLESHELGEGNDALVTSVFCQTPHLSPYLLAFAVGKFNVLETTTSLTPPPCSNGSSSRAPNRTGPITIRLLFPDDRPATSGMFALDLFKKAVDFFENFFGFHLPVSKIDMVGVRHMRFLGMENWGLITMLLPYLLVDEVTPIERRQRIARLIGHEVAHQWFGNLISIRWWKFVWLKEGLARYLEFCFASHCFPKWDMWVEFHSEVLDVALEMDAEPNTTHPIVCAAGCDNPRTIFDKFDTISYGKGAAVLRMVASLMGDQCLQEALQSLVHAHAFSSFDGDDFARCLDEHYRQRGGVNCDIIALLDYWLGHESHPIVFVEQKDTTLCVTQIQAPSRTLGVIPFLLTNQDTSSSQGHNSRSISFTNSPVPTQLANSPRRTFVVTPTTAHALQSHHEPVEIAIINPIRVLPLTSFPTPLHLLNMSTGDSSCTMLTEQSASIEIPWHSDQPTLVNPGASGVILVDYDTHTWQRLFTHGSVLPSQDIFSLTTTLYAHRLLHVGRICADDSIDRCCIMLEWLRRFCTGADVVTANDTSDVSVTTRGGAALLLTAVPAATKPALRYHGTTWRRIAGILSHYQSLLAAQGCSSEYNSFVTYLIAPLAKDGRVGFFPKGTATDYDASDAMSVETCNRLLQVLAEGRSPLLQHEAPIVLEWVLRSLYDVDLDSAQPSMRCSELLSAIGPCCISNDSHAVAATSAIVYLCACGNVAAWQEVMYVLVSLLRIYGDVKWRDVSHAVDDILPAHPTVPFASQFTLKDEVRAQSRLWCHHLLSSVVAFDSSLAAPSLAAFVANSPVITLGIVESVVRQPHILREVLALPAIFPNLLKVFANAAARLSGDYQSQGLLEDMLYRYEGVEAPPAVFGFTECDYAESVKHLASESLSQDTRAMIQHMRCNAGWAGYVSPHFQLFFRSMWSDILFHFPAPTMTHHHARLSSSLPSNIGVSPDAFLDDRPVSDPPSRTPTMENLLTGDLQPSEISI